MGQRAAQLIPKKFFKQHKILDDSAAQVLLLLYDNDLLLFPREKNTDWTVEPGEIQLEKDIRTCSDAAQLVKYMRKPMSGPCRAILLRRVLAFEADTLPLAEDLALRSVQDDFIDSFTGILCYSHKNPCPWVVENYGKIRSEFLKSQLCLILGIRGTPKYIDFLINEVDRLEGKSREDSLEQGPLVALNLLRNWPDEKTEWEPQDLPVESAEELKDLENAGLSPERIAYMAGLPEEEAEVILHLEEK